VIAITAAEAIVWYTALHRTAWVAAPVWTADHGVYLALYWHRLCWRLRRRTPRPADGETANWQAHSPLRPSALACATLVCDLRV